MCLQYLGCERGVGRAERNQKLILPDDPRWPK
jgi:hypothetical protein